MRFERQEPLAARRPRRFVPQRAAVPNPAAHATALLQELAAAPLSFAELPGFDPRRLVKLEVDQLSPEDLERLPGVTLVAQQDKEIIVAFLDEHGRQEFEARLQRIARGQKAARQDVLLAIRAIEAWGPDDRVGVTLRGPARSALTAPGVFALDVELWPLERSNERERMVATFRVFCQQHAVDVRDLLVRENVVIARVKLTAAGADALLHQRDVRFVDLPPRFGLPSGILATDLSQLPPVEAPPETAARIATLDSGIISGHPLLSPAVGDAQSFLSGRNELDEHGHGTMVAGIALYGDVSANIAAGNFQPGHWVLSGRVLDEANAADALIERQIVDAVEYFTGNNNRCRIFNLSIGDAGRPFNDARPGPWAVLLDELAKKHDVMFVVSTGNFTGSTTGPANWRTEYPSILLTDPEARIIDPAPSVNAITVGGLAEHELSRMAQRLPDDAAHQPVARRHMPSPFTRSGCGVGGAIKPELVEHAGNSYVDTLTQPGLLHGEHELGVVSMSRDFSAGRLFRIDSGTSFAAPKISWLAARILTQRPDASIDLARALIAVHAAIPPETVALLRDDEESLLRLAGYGRPDPQLVVESTERCVTLFAEEHLGEDAMHFYEVPIPDDFVKAPVRRVRRISIALAHTAAVRSTRIDYRASMFSFRLVRAKDLDAVVRAFKKAVPGEDVESGLPEMPGVRPSLRAGSRGTLQAATLQVKQTTASWREHRHFIVVTRRVPPWARGRAATERYALAVALEDRFGTDVRLHTQLRERLQQRARVRVQP